MNPSSTSADWRSYRPTPEAFADRVIMVTGATAGIGRAVARDLVRAGATVILHGRSEKALEALYQELKSLGPEPAVAQIDFERAQGPQYQALTTEIESRYGRLDGLLHNAGILGDRSPIEHYDIGLWQRVLLVNLTAPFILTRCLLPLLRSSADASLVFTTSGVGQRGRAFWGAYAVAKAGTERLAEVMADELENTAIRVNLVNPGPTRTRMRARAYPAENAASLLAPEDITPTYLYLLGAASRGIRGQRFEAQEPRRPAGS
jgi:NAD(P)-dependent dehydrogenase (short-subunit alcohol dehydrogenase family)